MTLLAEAAVGSGKRTDLPSAPETPARPSGDVPTRVQYYRQAFAGLIYLLRASEPKEEPRVLRRVLMAEGYREQADEALWFAESSVAAQAETLPKDE
jgi:hypothetical protein